MTLIKLNLKNHLMAMIVKNGLKELLSEILASKK
jgi:hypothetical protein